MLKFSIVTKATDLLNFYQVIYVFSSDISLVNYIASPVPG